MLFIKSMRAAMENHIGDNGVVSVQGTAQVNGKKKITALIEMLDLLYVNRNVYARLEIATWMDINCDESKEVLDLETSQIRVLSI